MARALKIGTKVHDHLTETDTEIVDVGTVDGGRAVFKLALGVPVSTFPQRWRYRHQISRIVETSKVRMSYSKAVQWIADNDESAEMDESVVAELPSVLMLSHISGRDPDVIAEKIVRIRRRGNG